MTAITNIAARQILDRRDGRRSSGRPCAGQPVSRGPARVYRAGMTQDITLGRLAAGGILADKPRERSMPAREILS
jgi:hypothetical protein